MTKPITRAQLLGNGGYWLLVYAALWWLLAGGSGWGFGLVCVATATAISLWLGLAPVRIQLIHLPRFLLFFLYEMWVGAWDVARRALRPHLPIDPAWVTYSLAYSDTRLCLLLSAMVGLLPGTLAVGFEQKHLSLHVLDQQQDWRGTVAQMENHLARLLGVKS